MTSTHGIEPAQRREHTIGGVGVGGVSLTVRRISAAEQLAFVQTQRSVSFLQTPAWGRVKTE